MTQGFAPRLDILPPPQRRLWPALAAMPAAFTLYGGTAIALQLGHRESIDFDFFSFAPLPPRLEVALPLLEGASVLQREPDSFTCLVDRDGPVRLSFFSLPRLRRLRPPLRALDTGLAVASLLDLAAAKASVVQQRAELKDYQDIDALLGPGGIDLPTMLAAAQAAHGPGFNPLATIKALSYFEDGNVARLPAAARRRLLQAIATVELGALPVILPEAP